MVNKMENSISEVELMDFETIVIGRYATKMFDGRKLPIPAEYVKILKLPSNLMPTALCPIGYASDKPNQKIRFPQEEVFAYT